MPKSKVAGAISRVGGYTGEPHRRPQFYRVCLSSARSAELICQANGTNVRNELRFLWWFGCSVRPAVQRLRRPVGMSPRSPRGTVVTRIRERLPRCPRLGPGSALGSGHSGWRAWPSRCGSVCAGGPGSRPVTLVEDRRVLPTRCWTSSGLGPGCRNVVRECPKRFCPPSPDGIFERFEAGHFR
jgi:hypothetical protein